MGALSYVTLTLDLYDGQGNPAITGSAAFTPSAPLTDAGVEVIGQNPIPAVFHAGGLPQVSLLATDSSGPVPAGWTWGAAFAGQPAPPAPFSFFLPANPMTFTATHATPCVFTGSGTAYLNGTGVQLSGGSLPAGFSAGITYYVTAASGSAFELAATAAGAALASTGTGSGSVIAVSQVMSNLIPVSSGTAFQGYLPLPSGTPASGQVPVATGTGEGSAWGNVAVNPMTTSGDTVYGGPGGALTRLPGDTSNTRKFLREQSVTGTAQTPAWDTLLAGDIPALPYDASGAAATAQGNAETYAASQASTAQSTAETYATSAVATETSRAETAEGLLAPKANPALTGTPTAPTASALTASTQLATTAYADAAVGVETSRAETAEGLLAPKANPALTGTPTAPTATALADSTQLATTAYADSAVGVETSRAETAEGLALPKTGGTMSGAIAMGSNKVTGLTNGSSAQDAAAYGQVPVVEGTVGNIQPTGTAAALGSSGKWPNSDHAHVQNYGGLFGDGSDGAATLDGTTANNWSTLAGSVYTMTRNAYLTSLVVQNGVTLKPAGFAVFAMGTVTVNSGGIITAAGNAGTAAGAAGASSGSGPYFGGRPGGAGATGNGVAGTSSSVGFLAAGAGGTGSGGTAGAGGTSSNGMTSSMLFRLPSLVLCTTVPSDYNSNGTSFTGGPGGGGGGGDSSHSGGGGGGGGGPIIIFAWAVINSGTIRSQGGAGGTPTTGNCGGGGGGTGGLILAYTLTAWTAGTTSVTAGAPGSGVGSGTAGAAGSAGTVLNVIVQ